MVDPEGHRRTIGTPQGTGDDQRAEVLTLRDGRCFERHVSPLGAVAGVPRAEGGVIVWWHDVTSRHLAEQRQEELTNLLELALVGADLAYRDVNVQTGEVRSHYERWHAILGYEPDDLEDNFTAWGALVHPDDAQARLAAWEAHLEGHTPHYEADFRMRHKAGHWVWLQARGRAVALGPDGRATRLVGTRQDITEAKLKQQGLHALAHTDELTGTDNRRRFMQRAEEELERARRYGLPVALLMMDLDHFKAINDRWGHAGGDAVPRSFAGTAQSVMRQSDILGRVGGEAFAALLPHTSLEGARVIGERLLEQVRLRPAVREGTTMPNSVSVGVSLARRGQTVQQLMADADHALYSAKRRGRNRLAVTEPGALPPAAP